MKKTRVLVLAGGESDEHEVSIVSTNSLLAAIGDTELEVTPLVITRSGTWLSVEQSRGALSAGKAADGGSAPLEAASIAEQFDVVFPLLHGPHGEDGTIQGMLELAGVPYVGSGVLASAMCMDKGISKRLLSAHGIPQVPGELITRHEWQTQREEALARCTKVSGPWFVKPANLGSSVGVSKVNAASELGAAIDVAAALDRRVVVEQGISRVRELETAVLGNDTPEASPVGEITYASEWYDYETKYTEGRAQLHIPAAISEDLSGRIRSLAVEAYRILDCAGLARVDFFHAPDSGELYLNEVNTMPGFTPFSMYTKLWQHAGLSYSALVERLVELALERHGQRKS